MVEQNETFDRRKVLKKAAAAGVVAGAAWSAPTLNGLSLRPNYAAAGSLGGPVANAAPSGTASMSSPSIYNGFASRGNDGNTNGNWGAGSVFHTGFEPNAWWQVNLGDVCLIQSVRLWNRTDCCATRAANVRVFVDGVLVGTAPGTTGSWVSSILPVGVTGQVVRVVNGFVGAQWFHLAEVQVFAQP